MKLRFAAVLLLLPCLVLAQTAAEKAETVRYLKRKQGKTGGFVGNSGEKYVAKPSLRTTSSCLRALRYFGGEAGSVNSAREFVLSCHDAASGGFADKPRGRPDVVSTAVGLMALVELKVPTEKYEKAAIAYLADNAKEFEEVRMAAAGLEAIGKKCHNNAKWLADLAAKQNPDGTFGKGKDLARETGSAVACILRLGGEVKDKAAVLKALDAAQRPDGGFGRGNTDKSDLETSYRVMRTYHMLKAKPKRADDLRAFVAKCRESADGSYGVTPDSRGGAPGTYYAGIILHWLGEK